MPRFSIRRTLAAACGVGLVFVGAAPAVSFAAPTAQVITVRTQGNDEAARTLSASAVNATLASVREVNYYPASNGWTRMWTDFDPSALNTDFARMHALGATVVRIIVFPSVFGYPTVSATYANRFAQVLQLAAANQLQVHLTLFDWWQNYSDVTGSEQWVKSLLAPYAGDSRIALLELKNELDPSDSTAVAWARQLLPYLATILPGVPRTVSVASVSPSTFSQLVSGLGSSAPDFWDYHYYGDPGQAYSTLAAIKRIAGSTPLFVGETGATTMPSGSESAAAADKAQALYLETVFAAARALGLPDPAPWTLNDFTSSSIPPSTVGSKPASYDFGLYTTSGAPKPAAQVVQDNFAGKTDVDIDGGFENESLPSGATVAGAWRINLPQDATFAIDDSVSHSGKASARISGSTGDSSGSPAFYVIPPQPVIGGTAWQASAWVRGQLVTGNVRIAFSWFDSAGNYLGQAESTSLPKGSTPWTQLTLSAKAPASATRVELFLKSSNDTGTAWFDDVTVAPVSSSTGTSNSSGSQLSTPSPSTGVTSAALTYVARRGPVVATVTSRATSQRRLRSVIVVFRTEAERRGLRRLAATIALPRRSELAGPALPFRSNRGGSYRCSWRFGRASQRFVLRFRVAGLGRRRIAIRRLRYSFD